MKRKMDVVVARAPPPPKLIGAYEKHQEIGRGTYGTVYAGVRSSGSTSGSDGSVKPTDRERVAIKKVLGRVDAGKREAAFLERCRDAQHIVKVTYDTALHVYVWLYYCRPLIVLLCMFVCTDRSWTRWSATTSCI